MFTSRNNCLVKTFFRIIAYIPVINKPKTQPSYAFRKALCSIVSHRCSGQIQHHTIVSELLSIPLTKNKIKHRNVWQSPACSPPGIAVSPTWRTVAKQNYVLIDAVLLLSSAANYSKICNLPQFTSMYPKSKERKLENAWQSLAYSPLGAVVSPPSEYL